jgi:hypothetical protein
MTSNPLNAFQGDEVVSRPLLPGIKTTTARGVIHWKIIIHDSSINKGLVIIIHVLIYIDRKSYNEKILVI